MWYTFHHTLFRCLRAAAAVTIACGGALLLFGVADSAYAQAPEPAGRVTQGISVTLATPRLGQKVTITLIDQPLGQVLRQLTLNCKGVRLTASEGARDQRVTLCVSNTPLSNVMERLVAVLSHAWPATGSYYWERPYPADEPAAFLLLRGRNAEAEAEAARDVPRQAALKKLRDMRTILRLPKSERYSYVSDLPRTFYDYAENPGKRYTLIKDLTDEQIARLMKGRDVKVGPVTLRVVHPDEGGYVPSRSNLFGLQEIGPGVDSDMLLLNDYSKPWDTNALPEPVLPKGQSPKTYDIGPVLNAPRVTDEQRADPGFVLMALARTAGITIYQEFFYKLGDNGLGILPGGIAATKGTIKQLLNAICRTWGYQAQKTGDGEYLLWSRTWAMDRLSDIPDAQLQPWRDKITVQGRLLYEDRLRIASEFTWPQVRVTLSAAIPRSVDNPFLCGTQESYWQYRLLGTLSDTERGTARTDQGIPIASLNTDAQQAFWQGLFSHNTYAFQHAPGGILSGEAALRTQGASARLFLKARSSDYRPKFIDENGPEQLILEDATGQRLY